MRLSTLSLALTAAVALVLMACPLVLATENTPAGAKAMSQEGARGAARILDPFASLAKISAPAASELARIRDSHAVIGGRRKGGGGAKSGGSSSSSAGSSKSSSPSGGSSSSSKSSYSNPVPVSTTSKTGTYRATTSTGISSLTTRALSRPKRS